MLNSIEDFQKLIFKKDGVWHTTCTDVLEDPDDVSAFFNVVKDLLNDGEVIHVYDDLSTDETCMFIFYKNGDEFLSQYLLYENGGYTFNAENITWSSNLRRYLNGQETADFIKTFKSYIKENNLPIKVILTRQQERFLLYPTTHEDISIDKQEKIKSLASFAKTILFLLCFVPAVIVAGITKNTMITFIAVGGGVLLYSAYFTIGILCKFRHVYCALQSINKMPMTPDEVNWNMFTTTEKWMRPIMYAIIGIIVIILAIVL